MQTQLIQPLPTNSAWLVGTGESEPVTLASLPFLIGRADMADLKIESTRVSREHAMIVHEAGRYRLRDLGSTNGTFVNGERITEAALSDGDLVIIADREFTFGIAADTSAERNCATQRIAEVRGASDTRPVDPAILLRTLQEAVLQRSVPVALTSIFDVEQDVVFGWLAEPWSQNPAGQELPGLPDYLAAGGRAARRAHELQRLVLAETVAQRDEGVLFLQLPPRDLPVDRALEAHLMELGAIVGKQRLVVGAPADSIRDLPGLAELGDRLRRSSIRLAGTNFGGSRAHVQPLADARLDFLLLAPQLVQALHGQGAARRQLAAVVEACQAMNCTPIISGVRSAREEVLCRELGCVHVAWPLGMSRSGTGFSPSNEQ